MNLLLDTCAFLWFVLGDLSLSPKARTSLCDGKNGVYLSVISIWEVILKRRMGKLDLPRDISDYVEDQKNRNGLKTLILNDTSIFRLSNLPFLHRDPFDRMLICQAIEHGLTIVTPDTAISSYPIKTLW